MKKFLLFAKARGIANSKKSKSTIKPIYIRRFWLSFVFDSRGNHSLQNSLKSKDIQCLSFVLKSREIHSLWNVLCFRDYYWLSSVLVRGTFTLLRMSFSRKISVSGRNPIIISGSSPKISRSGYRNLLGHQGLRGRFTSHLLWLWARDQRIQTDTGGGPSIDMLWHISIVNMIVEISSHVYDGDSLFLQLMEIMWSWDYKFTRSYWSKIAVTWHFHTD